LFLQLFYRNNRTQSTKNKPGHNPPEPMPPGPIHKKTNPDTIHQYRCHRTQSTGHLLTAPIVRNPHEPRQLFTRHLHQNQTNRTPPPRTIERNPPEPMPPDKFNPSYGRLKFNTGHNPPDTRTSSPAPSSAISHASPLIGTTPPHHQTSKIRFFPVQCLYFIVNA